MCSCNPLYSIFFSMFSSNITLLNVETTFQLTRSDQHLLQNCEYDVQVGFLNGVLIAEYSRLIKKKCHASMVLSCTDKFTCSSCFRVGLVHASQ
jgi:hypothetical protein